VILHKFWSAFMAQINKIANVFWEADPVAQLRYEYDQAVEQLKEGRGGLEQYRGLVERVTRQVAANRSHVQKLEAETKAYLKAGDRTTAAKFALKLIEGPREHRIRTAEAEVGQARARFDRTKWRLDNCKIVAPVDDQRRRAHARPSSIATL
jgi:phage shock protein A